jgi:adenosylhomocysteine nucleosidase
VPSRIEFAATQTKPASADMESTAIAQVCWTNQKPFLIVRSLSDLSGGQNSANPIDQTGKPVAESAAVVLREIIRVLPN